LVLEGLRECIGLHTCDKRGKRSIFEAKFPEFDIEKDLTEEDVLWTPHSRESLESQDIRAKGVLDMIFSDSESVYIAIAAHSGTIDAIFRVIGHKLYVVPPGGIIPVVIKRCA